ncbi:unnamed protein product [Bursaphelenchus okinawaensis]|uniref:Uncharacterized protein n=1 Tax=Bursaphelenchus okinawaensis TaxID=465554 RepID=A0A811LJG3_9BILA|nr:unnamed protein product [Bursaphelenchus okinawaensis]CAG9123567.1 unnamed protein product [Bursaphelenchus okinawaensis]
MKFNADLLKKVLDAKVLPEKHGQVICAEFISFAHSQNTVTRHSAKVCPHSSESIIETKYTIEGDALEQLRFIFTPKNLNILYVEGKWKEKHYLLKLDSTHKKLKSYQDYKKGKAWLVRDYVLYQKTPDEILFFALDGRSHSIDTGVFDLINALVVGSTESGDLWLPNHTCRHMKQTGTEYNIVVEKCPKPEKLLLSFSALKRLDAGLADDEAVSNFFALLYYEKAPVTKKVDTKTTIAGSETTLSPVTEEDIPLDEAYLETTLLPTEASEVSSDVCVEPSPWNNVWSFWIPTVLACILFLSTMIFFGLCRREYKKKKRSGNQFFANMCNSMNAS